ncbi:MAG: lysylphosphatidylglycerol synthase transmembrane domain-containing protein, partial [Egicoccus sp.]
AVDPRLLPLVLAVQVASSVTLTQVYRATYASQGGELRFRDALTVCLGAFSLTQLLPGGGAAGSVFVVSRLRRHGADPVRAVATAVLLGLVTIGTLGIGLTLATAFTAVSTGRHTAYAVASIAVTSGLVAVYVLLRRLSGSQRLRDGLADGLTRLHWRGRNVGAGWVAGLRDHGALLEHPRTLLRPAAWSAVNWSLDVVVLVLVMRAVGADAPFVAVLVGFAVANLLNSVPSTPGGIGVVDAGLAATLIAFGADPLAASVGVLAYRAIAVWLPVLVAAPVVAAGLRRTPRLLEVAA